MPALIERPKMSLAMWAALKSHIMRQREKKKQEQEADAAVERLRREQEMKRRQDAMTLEEIKDQLSRFERKLSELKEEKHQLFLQLKKVLHEDETRKRALVKEPSDIIQVSHPYAAPGMPVGAPPTMYMMGGTPLMSRTPVMYKVGASPQQNMLSTSSLKRSRSPSPPPPPSGNFQQGYNYKTHVTTYGQTAGASVVTAPPVVATSAPYPGYSPHHPQGQYPATPDQSIGSKHIPAPYHMPHLPQQGFVGSLHQQLEHANQKSGFAEEKYYVQQPAVVPLRGVAPLPAGQPVIQVQQQNKPGSITSGYPVRSQPPPPPTSAPHFQPPTSSNTATPAQAGYAAQQAVPRHTYPGQPTTRFY